MIAAPIPANEKERLQELYRYELLDTAYEEDFNEIVRLASKICNVPISLISLIDLGRQWWKAKVGLDLVETDRNIAFCSHAILNDELLEIPDTTSDLRFHDNPLVLQNPNIRYYAGMPLITERGYKLGTLCVIDTRPRQLEPEQTFALKVLGKQIIKLFDLRLRNKELQKLTDVQNRTMAIIAHDVRNPLASLKSSYELKNEGFLSEDDVRSMDEIVPKQLDNTIELLNNLVEWGKLQFNENANTGKVINFAELCNKCFGSIILSADSKKNKLLNLVNDEFEITGYPQQALEFIIRNLVTNANKFTVNGKITVEAWNEAKLIQITVADTGTGMNEKMKEAILSRKSTSSHLGTDNEKGSGLGLVLIHEYLQNLNGHLEIESVEGEGTIFSVILPLID